AQALQRGFDTDTPSPASAYVVLTVSQGLTGEHDAALDTVAAGRHALDSIPTDEFAENFLLIAVVFSHLLGSRYDEAHAAAQESLRRARILGNPSGLCLALYYFAWTRRPDETDETIRALEECLTVGYMIATPYRPHVLRALALLARLRARRGER